jgi:hypothetical protein
VTNTLKNSVPPTPTSVPGPSRLNAKAVKSQTKAIPNAGAGKETTRQGIVPRQGVNPERVKAPPVMTYGVNSKTPQIGAANLQHTGYSTPKPVNQLQNRGMTGYVPIPSHQPMNVKLGVMTGYMNDNQAGMSTNTYGYPFSGMGMNSYGNADLYGLNQVQQAQNMVGNNGSPFIGG